MSAPRIKKIEFLTPASEFTADSGSADLRVSLEDGGHSTFIVATPDQPGRWMSQNRAAFSFGSPVVYLNRLDEPAVARAAEALASEMSGYWLRYFNSEGDQSKVARTLKRP